MCTLPLFACQWNFAHAPKLPSVMVSRIPPGAAFYLWRRGVLFVRKLATHCVVFVYLRLATLLLTHALKLPLEFLYGTCTTGYKSVC